jgi:molybdate transport system substrate-binding protein
MVRRTWLVGIALAVLLGAQASVAQERARIFAAASLTDALGEVVTSFEQARPGVKVTYQFGGSSDLARQILAGAPADLFFSADTRQMDRVSRAGLVERESNVLSNQLVIVRHRSQSHTVKIDGPKALEQFDRIALADPEAVPAGVYARQYLESEGLWPRLRLKVVPTLDVRGALAAVASGNVDVGFVYRTDTSLEPRVEIVYAIPREAGPTITYRLGLLQGAGDAARSLFEYIRSDAARVVFERIGFVFLR